MKSLKKFKKLIVEGKESPLQDDNRLTVDMRIPQIRESAYKILNRKKHNEIKREIKEHSIPKKQQIKFPSRSISPVKVQASPLEDITNESENKQSSKININKSETGISTLELTEDELECLYKIIRMEKQEHESRIKEVENIVKIEEKVSGLRKKKYKSIQQPKKQQYSHEHRHHNSEHETQILSAPSSFDELNKTLNGQSHSSSDEKYSYETIPTGNIFDQSALQFKKIMYILQSKTRGCSNKSNVQLYKFKQPVTNNYRLIQQSNIPSISFRGDQSRTINQTQQIQPLTKTQTQTHAQTQKNPPKKAELLQIVSMLNTKYNKNIKFN